MISPAVVKTPNAEALNPELPQKSPENETTEISDQQLFNFSNAAESFFSNETATMIASSEALITTTAQNMNVTTETTNSVRQEIGLDADLTRIKEEAQRLASDLTAELAVVLGELPPPPNIKTPNEILPLANKIKRRKEQAQALKKVVAELRKKGPATLLKAFSEAITPEQIRGLEFTLLNNHGEQISFVDGTGKLVELVCSEENAPQILKRIKRDDEEIRGNSHELRSEILKRSKGKIQTHEAYTYGDITDLPGAQRKAYLNEPSNWTEERQLLHAEIVTKELEKARALSERLGDKAPTIYALRGNTAAGKTTLVKGAPKFQRSIDINGEPSGAINPDTYKEQLKSSERVFGREQITHFQSHNEGAMLARRIKKAIANSDSSMIIDQRLNEAKDIVDLLQESEKTGKKLELLDIDSPLELSLVRVLSRKPGGTDPIPPFNAIAEGYDGVRKNRLALTEAAINSPQVEGYVLYGTDQTGRAIKIAEKKDGVFFILEGQDRAYSQALDGNTESTVEQLRTQIIDEAYLTRAQEELKIPAFMVQSLAKYKGLSFEAALKEHSKQIDLAVPTRGDYALAALTNLENTSRTAKGTVDVSASADKAEKMAKGLTSENAADLAKNNFISALGNAYENKDHEFETPNELREFVESIASTINQGITKEGILIRQGEDSPKYPYTRVAELEGRMQQFYEELFTRIKNPKEDPVALAAWVEYKIDLSDHFFADGCGKTAKLLSSWVMMRAGKNLPDYTMHGKIPTEKVRGEYYANAPKTIPGTNPTIEAEELTNWTKYYRKLC